MTITRLFTYLLLFMVGGLLSCTDHPFQPLVTPGSTASRLRVKMLTLDLPNNQAKVSSFRYDGQGRLSQILTYQTPDSTVSEIEYSNYMYDQQNRLTGLRHEAVLFPRGSGANRVEVYTYSYNGSGQVSGINNFPGFIVGLAYNSSNKLTSASRSFATGGVSITGSDSFTFTGNNVTAYVTCISIAGHGGGASPCSGEGPITYTYDDKINPFYGVYVIPAPYPAGFINLTFGPGRPATYFGGTDNILNLSQNNVLTQTPSSSFGASVVYRYQYNAANLPTVRIKTTTTSGGPTFPPVITVETVRFEYELF